MIKKLLIVTAITALTAGTVSAQVLGGSTGGAASGAP